MTKTLFVFFIHFCINIYAAEPMPRRALDYLCQKDNPRTPTIEEFLQVLNAFNEKTITLLEHNNVTDGMHVQKAFIPSGSRVFFIGDIHGSRSLFRDFEYMKTYGLLAGDVYWVFLGDYADGGPYGVESYFGLLKLKLEHWDRVFLLRGNHETFGIAYQYGLFGFISEKPSELKLKFGKNYGVTRDALNLLFSLLPSAVYIGSGNPSDPDWIQCCHGGIEPTFNPNRFLQESRSAFCGIQENILSYQECLAGFHFNKIIKMFYDHTFTELDDCGFNWFDFCDTAIGLEFDRYRGYKCNPAQVARIYLNPCGLRAIIRGHQDCIFGLKIGGQRHWVSVFPEAKHTVPGEYSFKMSQIANCPVLTLSTAAGVKSPYDCFGILQTADSYDDWIFTPYEQLAPVN